MPILMNKRKDVIIKHEAGEASFAITWSFPTASDSLMYKIRKEISGGDKPAESPDKDRLVTDVYLRNSIKDVEGFVDESGSPIVLDDDFRREIYNYISGIEGYWLKVLSAMNNINAKNLWTGQMQSSSGSGDPTSASPTAESTSVSTVVSVDPTN